MRWIDFQKAMVAREEAIFWQAKMRLRVATDQEAIMLSEGEDTAFVRSCNDSEVYLHFVNSES